MIVWASYGVTHRRKARHSNPHQPRQAKLHPVTRRPSGPRDTCDDDLGDIQNRAVRCRFTVASFILGMCCENTHTHTAANTASMQTKTDWGGGGPQAGLCSTVGHTHAERTLHVQGRHARPFQSVAVVIKSSMGPSEDPDRRCSSYRKSFY